MGQSCLPGDLPRTSYSLDLQEVRTGQTKLWVTSCPIGLFAKVTRKQILWLPDWGLPDWKLETFFRISIPMLRYRHQRQRLPSAGVTASCPSSQTPLTFASTSEHHLGVCLNYCVPNSYSYWSQINACYLSLRKTFFLSSSHLYPFSSDTHICPISDMDGYFCIALHT